MIVFLSEASVAMFPISFLFLLSLHRLTPNMEIKL